MNITILNSLFPPHQYGGAEKSVALLAEALAETGDRVSVVSLHRGSAAAQDRTGGVLVHRLPLRNLYWPWTDAARPSSLKRLAWHLKDVWNTKAARDLGALLDRERPDVLHVNTMAGFSPSIWREAKRRGIPIVQTLRDYGLVCSRAALFRNGRVCHTRCGDCRLLTATRHVASRAPDLVVSNSRFVIDEHRRHGLFRETPSEIIYNIADVDLAPVRRPSFAEAPDLVFGHISRVEPEKGIEVILAALRMLPAKGWRLKVAGRGVANYVDRLQEASRGLPVEWMGFMAPADFYAGVDTVLISSVWHEPLPRTLIESLAAGKSTICSDSGGIPEISALGPVTATYPSTNAAALAEAMGRALAEPERWRFGAARAHLPPDFSKDQVAARYRAAYRRAIGISSGEAR